MKLTESKCLCRGCGEYFNSTTAFDMRRIGPPENRSCMPSGLMLWRGMDKNAQGYWVTKCWARTPDRKASGAIFA